MEGGVGRIMVREDEREITAAAPTETQKHRPYFSYHNSSESISFQKCLIVPTGHCFIAINRKRRARLACANQAVSA